MAYQRLTEEELRSRSFMRSVGWYEGKRIYPYTDNVTYFLYFVMVVWTCFLLVMGAAQENRITAINAEFKKHNIKRIDFHEPVRMEAWEEKHAGLRLNAKCK